MKLEINTPGIGLNDYTESITWALEQLKRLKTCQLSHNSDWYSIPMNLQTRGDVVWDNKLFVLEDKYMKNQSLPYDAIMNWSNTFLKEDVLNSMRGIAKGISIANKKDVSLGYAGIDEEAQPGNPGREKFLMEHYRNGTAIGDTSVGERLGNLLVSYALLLKDRESKIELARRNEAKRHSVAQFYQWDKQPDSQDSEKYIRYKRIDIIFFPKAVMDIYRIPPMP